MKPSTSPSKHAKLWDNFFYHHDHQFYTVPFRIGFSLLILLQIFVLTPDLDHWFSEEGILPLAASQKLLPQGRWTLLQANIPLHLCWAIFTIQILCLLAGFLTRFQALCIFIWLITFQNRNILMFDGEDTVLRLFSFFLIFLPCSQTFSVDALIRKRNKAPLQNNPAWAIRLIQIQIYFSTFLFKVTSEDWTSGLAIPYITYLNDLYGKFPIPGFILESLLLLKMVTWAIVIFEGIIPFTLWHPKWRKASIIVALGFHLASDYAMNLFLFHWVMILGVLSFSKPQDYHFLKVWASKLSPQSPKHL